MTTIHMSDTKNAEMIHDEEAIASERKWHETCEKLRADGVIK